MKKLSLKLLGAIIVVIMLLQSTVVIAANINQLNNEKEQNQDKIDETKEKKEEITEQKNQTVAEVEKLNTQISDYESQIAELDSKISDLNGQIKESQEKLTKAQEDYTKQEELLEARLVAIQEAGETSYLDFLLSSDSITDLISNYYLVTELTTNDTELLEKIQKQKEEIEKAKTELENSKTELDTSKASKQSVSTQLKTAKEEKNKQVAQLSEDEKKLQAQIDELNQANKSIDSKIAAAIKQAQENSNKNSSSGGNSGGGSPTAPSSSGFIYPVPSGYTKITTGMYYSSGQYHGAVDFGSAGINGQPVYAVAGGEVIVSERLSGSYGNYIIIMHDNGVFTLYAHGQDGSRTVSAGQRVTQGQQIMRVGSTGNSTGPHLHFEVRTYPGNYSNRVNPANYGIR
ncbi:MAG: murein hydrolase activator EnvC family protein [Clostridia bacterium]